MAELIVTNTAVSGQKGGFIDLYADFCDKKNFTFIAGPCAVESERQIMEIAKELKKTGVKYLRGGAFKARTSPYSFQGLGEDGLKLLVKAGKEYGLKTVCEITDQRNIDLYSGVDVLQIGARNMQNFPLLLAVGKTDKPVILKRGFSNTIEELLSSAEYIFSEGNGKVILCERGIRTFEKATRNTLDLGAVAYLKKMTNLPVIVDPSHATGIASLVEPTSLAAAAVGADGLMIEVHSHPSEAKSDGKQAITPSEFARLSERVKLVLGAISRK
ncbi:MAG: 3-deoxy-7-phosphoheptulonate synthase [Clostridia bacterium]|nr:3-deoxy-7-phosphoheptulonate synthase [Clostridia bacterium]MBR1676309.1 3-deoxy-7-phosphoheptulonate synthase [Clostridia bacterium]